MIFITLGEYKKRNRWADDLGFYVFLKSISVISERWGDDYERLCAMEPALSGGSSQPGTTRSVGQG